MGSFCCVLMLAWVAQGALLERTYSRAKLLRAARCSWAGAPRTLCPRARALLLAVCSFRPRRVTRCRQDVACRRFTEPSESSACLGIWLKN